MPTTEEILAAADQLGKLIAQHAIAKKFEDTVRKLQGDVEAQRVLNDYNRHMQKLGEKEAQGKPIEVADKQQLDKLQQGVIRNATLRDFQVAQMDYLDLMRRVDEAMSGGPAPEAASQPATGQGPGPLLNPAPGSRKLS